MQFKEMIVRVPSNDVASSSVVPSMIWTAEETNKSPGDIFCHSTLLSLMILNSEKANCVSVKS